MILDYLYLYLINPFFLILDYVYEYKQSLVKINEDTTEKYEYDINEDKIIITYFTDFGKKYILKVDRKIDINLKEVVDSLKKLQSKEVIFGASYNGNDILEQVSNFLGPFGKHNNYSRLLVRDVLTEEQIVNFQSLSIIDELCEIHDFNGLNEYLL